MVLYTIKILLPVKDISETLPSSGFNNFSKILLRKCSRKTVVKELEKMEEDNIVLNKGPPVLYL